MINQQWLKTFCTLVDVGHFTQTAEQLFMTQSGVSQHIKKLEQQLATDLLIREGKSFTLTEAGSKLYLQGQQVLQSIEQLAQLVKKDDKFHGNVRIASPGSIGLKLYPFLLDIQQQYPHLIMDHTFAPNPTIEANIAERKCDLGLTTELSQSANITSKKIAAEPLVLITPASMAEVTWSSLLTLGFVSHPDANHHAQLLLSQNFDAFEHISQFPHKGFSNQIGLICEPVALGLGFTVLPLHAVNEFRDQSSINVHRLGNPVFETLYLCTNNKAIQSERVKFVQQAIVDYLAISP